MPTDFPDSKVPPKLRRQVYDLINGVEVCLSQQPPFALPALILIYAGIDAMAWVSIADDRFEVTGRDFRNWAARFLLPNSKLQCSADDLWAARCGMVHAQIMDSKHAQRDRARHLWYYVGPGNVFLIPLIREPQKRPLTISIGHLGSAFKNAVRTFFDTIENEEGLRNVVWPRAEQYYDEVRVHGEPGTEGSWVETIPTVYGTEDDES